MDLVTLGMFIIDEIHFLPPTPPSLNILGGAGTYAVFGARLFRPPPASRGIGWTIHKGSDFPESVETEIGTWDTTCNFVKTPWRKTTRGWNKYGADEERAFKYLTEKLHIDETQLTDEFLEAKIFHLICTPTRCMNLVKGILRSRRDLRKSSTPNGSRPLFVWEPVPDACGPAELENLFKALEHVDVVSPNHQELGALFGRPEHDGTLDERDGRMKQQCDELLERGFGEKNGVVVVVRCGERGCYVASKDQARMIPAYYSSGTKVVDPTGAGNAFLGGFGVGLLEEPPGDLTVLENAAAFGSVAASFAVEQVGLPKLTKGDGEELWNGDDAGRRLGSFRAFIGNHAESKAEG